MNRVKKKKNQCDENVLGGHYCVPCSGNKETILPCSGVGLLSIYQLQRSGFLSVKACCCNWNNYSFIFSACVINSHTGVYISSKAKAKRHRHPVSSIFVFSVSHIANATFNTLIAYRTFSEYRAALVANALKALHDYFLQFAGPL